MRIIGLTGGISSGKSTVSNLFKSHGIPIVDADIVARDALKKGSGGWKKVVAAFGEEILLDNCEVNRPKLGQIVFSDPDKRQFLNRATMDEQSNPLILVSPPFIGDNHNSWSQSMMVALSLKNMHRFVGGCLPQLMAPIRSFSVHGFASTILQFLDLQSANTSLTPHWFQPLKLKSKSSSAHIEIEIEISDVKITNLRRTTPQKLAAMKSPWPYKSYTRTPFFQCGTQVLLLAPYISSGIFWAILKLWLKGHKVIVLDVPLLFEAKMDKFTKPIIVVWVDPEQQIQRLMARDKSSEEDARNRINAQMPLDVKRSKADIVIDNTGSLDDLNQHFQKVLLEVSKPLTWTEFWLSRQGAFIILTSLTSGVLLCIKMLEKLSLVKSKQGHMREDQMKN
ncbi:hypothetical protein Lal_00017510, partial [Lupinus albus]